MWRVLVDPEDAPGAAEFVIDRSKVDFLDSELAKQRSAHDARLDGDIKGAFGDDRSINSRRWMELLSVREEMPIGGIHVAPGADIYVLLWHAAAFLTLCRRSFLLIFKIRSRGIRQQGRDGHEFSMASTVAADVCRVHAFGNHPAPINEYAADGSLIGLES